MRIKGYLKTENNIQAVHMTYLKRVVRHNEKCGYKKKRFINATNTEVYKRKRIELLRRI